MSVFLRNLILLITICFASSQGAAQNNIKRSTGYDTLKINQYFTLAKQKFEQRKMDSAELLYKKAYVLSKQTGNKRKTIEIIARLSHVFSAGNKYAESLRFANESLALSKQLKDTALILDAYIRTGAQHCYLFENKQAALQWTIGLRLAEIINDLLRQVKLTANLSVLFLNLQDARKSYKYAKQAYMLSKKINDTVLMATSAINLSYSEGIMGNFTAEAYHLREAIKLGNAIKDYTYAINAYINLGVSSEKQGKFQAALNYYVSGLNVARKRNYHNYDMTLNMAMADGLKNVNRSTEALVYIKKGLAAKNRLSNPSKLAQLYEIASGVYEKLNKSHEALTYFRKNVAIKDSLTRSETEAEVNRIEMEYQTAKKEKEIATQKLTISRNKLELQKKNSYILIFILVSIILLTIATSIYLIYSGKYKLIQRKKELAILEAMISGEEKERSRLAMNLHDGIGGILSVVKMHVDILSNEHGHLNSSPLFAKTVSLLDTAAVETRALAHNLAPQILFYKGLDPAISTFCEKANNPDLEVIYYSIGQIGRFNTEFELFIYRTVQEGFNNIVKHAGAKKAIIQLSNNLGLLSLTIEDNGIGMNAAAVGINGLGLSSLRSRTIAKGGIFEISSQLHEGTTIYMEFDTTFFISENIYTDTEALT